MSSWPVSEQGCGAEQTEDHEGGLSQADLIRNFVLMDLPPLEQEQLYERYWFPMEQAFRGENEKRFDEFVRNYLTVVTGQVPRLGDIYEAYKDYAAEQESFGTPRGDLLKELNRYASWFVAMALGAETNPRLAPAFAEIEQLRANVVYPFFLRLYGDYVDNKLTAGEFRDILDAVVAYLFRRAVCRIPTNSLNTTFASFASAVNDGRYVESVLARFLTLGTYKRFPSDEEFERSLREEDLYHFARAPYFFRKLENHGRKEEVSTADYSIEHNMPQNEQLSPEWRDALGPEWKEVHGRLLHTLGNLTLTGYNPELSDRPFIEKRDIEGGFKNSPLRLNQGLGQLDTWNEAEIEKRATALAARAVTIWKQPTLPIEVLADYETKFTDGTRFDWTLAHTILATIPAGKWTGYFYLAEAIDTSAQAVGSHVAVCASCENAHRVMTWDGQVSKGFKWVDPNETRSAREVLESEGIRFINDLADPDQRLVTEDLVALVEDP